LITERTLRALTAGLLAVASLGCDESLPPRDDPTEIVRARLFAMDTRLVMLDSVTVTMGSLMVRIELENLYDDVLDGPAQVRGEVRVWLRDLPEKRRTFVWTRADLQTPGVVRGSTATLGVDSAAMLSAFWDHRTDEGEPFWKFSTFRHLFTPGGQSYYLSDSVYFQAEGKMQLFRDVPLLQAPPINFAVVYQIRRVTPP
jgi:hypothetical protein